MANTVGHLDIPKCHLCGRARSRPLLLVNYEYVTDCPPFLATSFLAWGSKRSLENIWIQNYR